MNKHKGFGPVTLAAPLVALLLAAPSAQAATGSYTYVTTSGGPEFKVENPVSDTCLPLGDGAVRFSNDTTDTAFLYTTADCSDGWHLVGVGATWDAPTGVQAQAVRLGSTQ
ncbi:hypothetical protein [Nonomuraea insulae]|uniref:Uncharacterized protein n=1 Tax=Nonomuraea insulae TaxID=1616787 RepID=A0ABW1D905_9ACTN